MTEFNYPLVRIIFDCDIKSLLSKHPSVCFCSIENDKTVALVRVSQANRETVREVKADFKKYGRIDSATAHQHGATVITRII